MRSIDYQVAYSRFGRHPSGKSRGWMAITVTAEVFKSLTTSFGNKFDYRIEELQGGVRICLFPSKSDSASTFRDRSTKDRGSGKAGTSTKTELYRFEVGDIPLNKRGYWDLLFDSGTVKVDDWKIGAHGMEIVIYRRSAVPTARRHRKEDHTPAPTVVAESTTRSRGASTLPAIMGQGTMEITELVRQRKAELEKAISEARGLGLNLQYKVEANGELKIIQPAIEI